MKTKSKFSAYVLMHAFDNAGSDLALSMENKAKILDITSSTPINSLVKGGYIITNGELGLHFIQFFQTLYQITSAD